MSRLRPDALKKNSLVKHIFLMIPGRFKKEGRGPNALEERACDGPNPKYAEPRRLGADSGMIGFKKGRNFLFTMPNAKRCLSIIGKNRENFNTFWEGAFLH
jgi:hypothetical protein